ncbi:protein-L-isoaspartate(D-aspartate) O-methyltransferase [Natronobacterium texcoconense]|uniref:Protein-L-isoaspartate O-methyltransferase n=1 Tax=Natronobacterium texcoconense TaxID=1095778 RepID=A0A1H1HKU8_NATTX|nr:protein-L-isoaspartate(D-aspartate) O-methyltransferase [Natronobacterium texcoconense]SDR26160.1 protein-L-isoaspartate(D-aspartate) O-methyltransferase [Natronobacterium texcoconense]
MFDRFGSDDPGDGDDYETARKRMVGTVASRVDDDRVLEALESVPRHEFVPSDRRGDAYADRPLPIGEGQTISAPHMVAIMADRLALEAGESVLEIGTGCGYHAAVTAELVGAAHVYSVEYGEELAEDARKRLEETGYGEVSVRVGDGRKGWAEHAPYDAAYFTCATAELPDPVVEQVRPGGRILAPIGSGFQTLVKATKRADGSLERTEHGGVRFVRMRG